MLVAKEKKEKNIAEYILYMWQVEDIIRALEGDPKRLDEYVKQSYHLPQTQLEEVSKWYADLAKEMKEEKVLQRGHLKSIQEIISTLNEMHLSLLKMPSQALYSALYYKTLPAIIQLRKMDQGTANNEVETCFVALYGYVTLRLQGSEISKETLEGMKQISTFLAMLSDRYHEHMEGGLEIPLSPTETPPLSAPKAQSE